jgi:hypothetical protein
MIIDLRVLLIFVYAFLGDFEVSIIAPAINTPININPLIGFLNGLSVAGSLVGIIPVLLP